MNPRAPQDETGSQSASNSDRRTTKDSGVQWANVTKQVLAFTGIQHAYRFTEKKTRRGLKGPWLRDWFQSASSPWVEPHWSDKGADFTNYVAHPMQGSVYGLIYSQNDPSGRTLVFSLDRKYLIHLTKASTISAVSSLQFELGPFSEASLGNVGLPPDRFKMAWVDIIITPTLGAVWMAGEDALDRYVIEPLERKIANSAVKHTIRVLLNPTRSMANLVGSKKPWKRHQRP